MRVEKRGSDWVRTWAFKIDEARAKHEGYDTVRINGSLDAAEGYPGCPYCGEAGFALCHCGKMNCSSGFDVNSRGESELTCNWCGATGTYSNSDNFDVSTDGD
jgi:hypothetical protein